MIVRNNKYPNVYLTCNRWGFCIFLKKYFIFFNKDVAFRAIIASQLDQFSFFFTGNDVMSSNFY